MSDNVAEVFAAVQRMKAERVVQEYALGGAMALIFWSEPVATFDVGIFVLLESSATLVSLASIYEWASRNGYPTKAEHVIIAGVPVQVIPAHSELAVEAIEKPVDLDYDARSQKRLQRVAGLLDEDELDRAFLDDLLRRYKLQLPQQR